MSQANTFQQWWCEQEDVVISGMSCRFPESKNMAEFRDNLMNGKDMVTDDALRFPKGKLHRSVERTNKK